MQQSHRLWSFVLFWNRRKTKIVTFAVLQRILRVVCEFFSSVKTTKKKNNNSCCICCATGYWGLYDFPTLCAAYKCVIEHPPSPSVSSTRFFYLFIFFFSHFFLFQSSETIEFFCAQSNCRQLLSRFFAFIRYRTNRVTASDSCLAFVWCPRVMGVIRISNWD